MIITTRARGRTPAPRRRTTILIGAAIALVLVASGCIVDGSWTSSAALPMTTQYERAQVSCVSEDWCLASSGGMHVWDGSTWSPAPNPPSIPGSMGQGVEQIDCMAVDRCLAVELQWDEWGDYDYYLLAFDGSAWTEATEVGPLGAIDPIHLSCGAGGCVVLDDSDRTITWDGSTYTQDSSQAGGVFVETMSCAAIDDCIGLTLEDTRHWDGESWTVAGYGGPDGYLRPALDCPVSDRCVAIGARFEESEVRILIWDGATWTEEAYPSGMQGRYVLSCRWNLECLAIQGRTAMTFNSQDWFVAPTAPGPSTTGYADVSCVAEHCMAIGYDVTPPRSGVVARYQWTYS